MAPSCFVSVVQADWRAMVRRKHHSLHECCWWPSLYEPQCTHPLTAASSRIVCHKTQILLNWGFEHDNEFPPIKHFCDEIPIMDVQPTVWCCHDSIDQNLRGIFPIKSELRETGSWSQYTQNKNKNKKDWKTIPYQHFKGLNVHYWAGLSVLCFFSVSAMNLYKSKMAILETAYV